MLNAVALTLSSAVLNSICLLKYTNSEFSEKSIAYHSWESYNCFSSRTGFIGSEYCKENVKQITYIEMQVIELSSVCFFFKIYWNRIPTLNLHISLCSMNISDHLERISDSEIFVCLPVCPFNLWSQQYQLFLSIFFFWIKFCLVTLVLTLSA